MTTALLSVEGISKRFGGFAALSDIHFKVPPGQRLGIIGPNGSGKTTLINCICGSMRVDSGAVHFGDTDVTRWPTHRRTRAGIAHTFQLPRPFLSMSVGENISTALQYLPRSSEPTDVASETQTLLTRMGLAEKRDYATSALSQVDLRRLELARAIATRPQLVILDEVMAGLSPAEVDALLDIIFALNASGITVVMIEHIMRAIMRFSERVLCLDAGILIADADPQSIVENETVRKVYLGA